MSERFLYIPSAGLLLVLVVLVQRLARTLLDVGRAREATELLAGAAQRGVSTARLRALHVHTDHRQWPRHSAV